MQLLIYGLMEVRDIILIMQTLHKKIQNIKYLEKAID